MRMPHTNTHTHTRTNTRLCAHASRPKTGARPEPHQAPGAPQPPRAARRGGRHGAADQQVGTAGARPGARRVLAAARGAWGRAPGLGAVRAIAGRSPLPPRRCRGGGAGPPGPPPPPPPPTRLYTHARAHTHAPPHPPHHTHTHTPTRARARRHAFHLCARSPAPPPGSTQLPLSARAALPSLPSPSVHLAGWRLQHAMSNHPGGAARRRLAHTCHVPHGPLPC